jgi:3-oxoacyl-[acyl-carrier protein] reductase
LQIEAENPSNLLAIEADSTNITHAENVVSKTIDTFGRLDILIINAGIAKDRVIWKLPNADFDEVLNTNLKGTFFMIKAASPLLRKQQSGKIITIASINGLRGKAGQSAYSASKGAIIALTKSVAKELGPKNINVNAIAPGLITTDMTNPLPDAIKETAIAETAIKRAGTPDDVADTALFLASDGARHITGQVINVDGGQLM